MPQGVALTPAYTPPVALCSRSTQTDVIAVVKLPPLAFLPNTATSHTTETYVSMSQPTPALEEPMDIASTAVDARPESNSFGIEGADALLASAPDLTTTTALSEELPAIQLKKDLLAKLSPVFADMVSLGSGSHRAGSDRLPLVQLEEDEATLKGLLMLALNDTDPAHKIAFAHDDVLVGVWEAGNAQVRVPGPRSRPHGTFLDARG